MRSDARKKIKPTPILTGPERKALIDAAFAPVHVRGDAVIEAVEALLKDRS